MSQYKLFEKIFTLGLSAHQSNSQSGDRLFQKAPNRKAFIDWSAIPLQHKAIDTSLIYVSALPQMLRGNYDFYSAKSLSAQTQRLAEELNQFQLQTSTPIRTQSDTAFNFISTLWNEFAVEAERPGWITFKLSNRGLWYWIEQFQINAHSTKPKHTLFISQRLPPNSETAHCEEQEAAPFLRCSKSHAQSSEQLSPRLENAKKTHSHHPLQPRRLAAKPANQLLWQVQYSFACCCSLIRQLEARPSDVHIKSDVHVKTVCRDEPADHPSISPSDSDTADLTTEPSRLDDATLALLAIETSTLWTLISEMVATIDALHEEKYLTSSKADGQPKQRHAINDDTHHPAPLSLKQAGKLCQALDAFYRVDWGHRRHRYPSKTVIRVLIAARETLQILLHQYGEQASDSL